MIHNTCILYDLYNPLTYMASVHLQKEIFVCLSQWLNLTLHVMYSFGIALLGNDRILNNVTHNTSTYLIHSWNTLIINLIIETISNSLQEKNSARSASTIVMPRTEAIKHLPQIF